jgi:hypothetical protein
MPCIKMIWISFAVFLSCEVARYFHRSPASRKRRQQETQCPGVYLSHPVPGGNKYGEEALQDGRVSRIGTLKDRLESRGTALERTSSNRKVQTRLLVREEATK